MVGLFSNYVRRIESLEEAFSRLSNEISTKSVRSNNFVNIDTDNYTELNSIQLSPSNQAVKINVILSSGDNVDIYKYVVLVTYDGDFSVKAINTSSDVKPIEIDVTIDSGKLILVGRKSDPKKYSVLSTLYVLKD
jgi:hypothetical protein